MSISAAPAATDASISRRLSSSGDSPAGNPVETAATGIALPSSASQAAATMS